MRTPALAVVGADHQIIRSTESFRRNYQTAATLCERAPELDLVLTGRADAAVIDLGEFSVAIEAVTDGAGKRQAMLSLPTEDLASDPESPLTALREAAEESPAMVWAKDLDGRYLYANGRFLRDLETSEERLVGSTDAELQPEETVDGPRLRYIEDGLEEPLQLEYSVPECHSRPPMVAFRFALRNGSGKPIGTCGVAAPSAESHLARDEAVRLMQLERWNRLDPLDVRAEVLEQWHVQPTPGPAASADTVPASPEPVEDDRADDRADAGSAAREPTFATVESSGETEVPAEPEPAAEPVEEPSAAPAGPSQERVDSPPSSGEQGHRREEEWVRQLRQAALMSAGDSTSETAGALQTDLQLARRWAERADQLQGDLHAAHARIREAEGEAHRAAAAAQQASEESARARLELEELRQELDREKADAQAARSEVEVARRELGAARAQAESLRGPADAALRLSEELGRALAAERERGDELARTLARIRSRLGDLDGALDRSQPVAPAL